MAIVEDRSPTFETVLTRLIGCIYFLSVGSNKNQFWMASLTLIFTRSVELRSCKVPTDLVKINLKEATHMGFHYRISKYKHHTAYAMFHDLNIIDS